MKLAPRGGMMTSLVEVNGRTVAAGWEGGAAAALIALETSAVADSANAGIPARAKDAVAAPFNKLRREILSMIEYLSAARVKNYSTGHVITQVGAEAYQPYWLPDNHSFLCGHLQRLSQGAPPAGGTLSGVSGFRAKPAIPSSIGIRTAYEKHCNVLHT